MALTTLLSSIDPDKVAPLFNAAVAGLAAYAAALVTLRVGRGSRIVTAREKGPVLELGSVRVSADGGTVSLTVGNAGAGHARWVEVRCRSERLTELRHVPLIKPGGSSPLRFATGMPAGTGLVAVRIEISCIGLNDLRTRDGRIVRFDLTSGTGWQEPVSMRLPFRVGRRLLGL